MKHLQSLLPAVLAALTVLSPLTARAATISPGDLIKASGQAVYYFAADGKRYVFPTEKTYKSWYVDFSGVKIITDAELAALSIGGNVTYRPGVRLVKVTTDPRVYAVDGRSLRWIATEALAIQLFGATWATQVDDIPDAFFVNYTMGSNVVTTDDYVPATVRNAYTAIQATISATVTPPTTPTTPTPPTSTTSTTLGLTITPDKATAQSNESIFLLAETPYTGSITKLEIFADGTLFTSCSARICSTSWTVPSAGIKASYDFRAKLTTADGQTAEATTSTTIVTMPFHASIQMLADRTVIRSGQTPNLRAAVTAGLSSTRTEIVMDGAVIKACVTTPNDCRYTDYVTGTLGSTHEVYATVTTLAGLRYRSQSLTITIGTNDTPMITLVPDRTEIFSGESVGVTLTAQDNDGLGSVSISKDGQVIKTCQGAAPCTVMTGPWSLPVGTVLTFNGFATDLLNATGTALTTVTIK